MDTNNTKYVIGFLVAIFILVGLIAFLTGTKTQQSALAAQYDLVGFAQCLKDQGATFYGAFWCPHCQATKRIFGPDAVKKLPYFECSTPDGQSQIPACTQAGVEGYPTWVFKDGSRIVGELSPNLTETQGGLISITDLSQHSNCPIVPLNGGAPIVPTPASSTPSTATSTASTSSSATSKAR
jgi:thiol-disulfide isomerase/thioredoxin